MTKMYCTLVRPYFVSSNFAMTEIKECCQPQCATHNSRPCHNFLGMCLVPGHRSGLAHFIIHTADVLQTQFFSLFFATLVTPNLLATFFWQVTHCLSLVVSMLAINQIWTKPKCSEKNQHQTRGNFWERAESTAKNISIVKCGKPQLLQPTKHTIKKLWHD